MFVMSGGEGNFTVDRGAYLASAILTIVGDRFLK